jgi:Thioesterase-like superfamily
VADAWGDLIIDGESRSLDHELLGLAHHGPGQAGFELTRSLARFDGRLFGGTAIAVAIALAEVETARPSLWMTVQFIAADTTVGDRFVCTTEILAEGRSAAQVRVTGRVEDREIFCALGATAHRKSGRVEVAFERFPSVPAPEAAAPFQLPIPAALRPEAAKVLRNIEMRHSVLRTPYCFCVRPAPLCGGGRTQKQLGWGGSAEGGGPVVVAEGGVGAAVHGDH